MEVMNSFQVLQDEASTADSIYENFTKAHNESVDQHIPVRKKNTWESFINITRKCQDLHKGLDENRKNPTQGDLGVPSN